jgi:hypothetical protein
MKKTVFVFVVFFVSYLPIFAQNIDKSKYQAIDPFDYELSIKQIENGAVRQYKSTRCCPV